MPRTGENIRKRKDGRWEARVYDDFKYKSLYAHSYAEIKEKKKLYENNALIINHNLKFVDAYNNWLLYIRNKVKDSTYARYTFLANRYILPYLGNIKISKLNNNLLNSYTNRLLMSGSLRNEKGLSNKTVCDILSVIKNIINYHYEYYSINAIPIRIHYPKVTTNNIQILSEYEIRKLERYIYSKNEPYLIGIIISLYFGLRIGEVCALKWSDFDFKARTIHVSRTMQRITNNNHSIVSIDSPKTESSNRVIPIPDFLFDYLNKYKTNDEDYILTGNSSYIEPRCYYNKYKKMLDECNISNHSYHALRHTFATRCIDLGFDIKTLSEILGHSSVNVTLRVYVHPTMKMKRKAMNKLKMCL